MNAQAQQNLARYGNVVKAAPTKLPAPEPEHNSRVKNALKDMEASIIEDKPKTKVVREYMGIVIDNIEKKLKDQEECNDSD